jgi:hypothetical protein
VPKLSHERRLQQAEMSALQLRKSSGAFTGSEDKETIQEIREMT